MMKDTKKRLPIEGNYMEEKNIGAVYTWLLQNSYVETNEEGKVKRRFTLASKIIESKGTIVNGIEIKEGIWEVLMTSTINRKTQEEIIKPLSRATFYRHLEKLQELGYITIVKNGRLISHFDLHDVERFFFEMPSETLNYLTTATNSQVVKIYCYLGDKLRYANEKGTEATFTKKELYEKLGYTHKKDGYNYINIILDALKRLDLVSVCSWTTENLTELHRVLDVKYVKQDQSFTRYSAFGKKEKAVKVVERKGFEF